MEYIGQLVRISMPTYSNDGIIIRSNGMACIAQLKSGTMNLKDGRYWSFLSLTPEKILERIKSWPERSRKKITILMEVRNCIDQYKDIDNAIQQGNDIDLQNIDKTLENCISSLEDLYDDDNLSEIFKNLKIVRNEKEERKFVAQENLLGKIIKLLERD